MRVQPYSCFITIIIIIIIILFYNIIMRVQPYSCFIIIIIIIIIILFYNIIMRVQPLFYYYYYYYYYYIILQYYYARPAVQLQQDPLPKHTHAPSLRYKSHRYLDIAQKNYIIVQKNNYDVKS